MRRSVRRPLCALLCCATVMMAAGCASDDEELAYEERPVDQLYNEALNQLIDATDFEEAARSFEEVERQHPYSVWATKAQLMAAYAFYENGNYDEAILAMDRFIELHPGNEDVGYAYYLRAISFYEQIQDVQRDQAITREAMAALREVINRFPDSDYARDARLKLDLTIDHLAGKEMAIGRFYLQRNQVLAAITRFNTVVQDFQTTTHVPEALYRLVESYSVLGLHDQATKSAAVLGHNYPGSSWYRKAYRLARLGAVPPEPQPGEARIAAEEDGDRGWFGWLF